jgi:hypothetical protein
VADECVLLRSAALPVHGKLRLFGVDTWQRPLAIAHLVDEWQSYGDRKT